MAVDFLAKIDVYQGLSTDDKPIGVPVGSTFQELDGDQFEYVFTAESRWVLTTVNKLVTESGTFEDQMLSLMRSLLEHQSHMTGLPAEMDGDE